MLIEIWKKELDSRFKETGEDNTEIRLNQNIQKEEK